MLTIGEKTGKVEVITISLEEQRSNLQHRIGEAQNALDHAKAHQKATNEYMDPIKFAELKQAIREGTTQLHELNRKLKVNRPRPPNHRNPEITHCVNFKEAAFKTLDENTYNAIDELSYKLHYRRKNFN